MQKSILTSTTLLTLLTFFTPTAAQSTSESWGTPFSVAGPSAASTETLVPSSNQVLTNPLRSTETLAPSAASGSVSVSPIASLSRSPSASNSDVTLIEGTRQSSGQSSFTATLPRPTESGRSMATASGTGSRAVVPTGGASLPKGYAKLGVAGALAGAAGVLFV